MDSRGPIVFEFGQFRLDRGRRTLTDVGGAAVPLTGKAFDALVFFLERFGEVVERDALMDALWPGLVVEPNNLSQVVLALRRALGDGYIVTIKGRGYQFVMPVAPVSDTTAAAGAHTPGPAAPVPPATTPADAPTSVHADAPSSVHAEAPSSVGTDAPPSVHPHAPSSAPRARRPRVAALGSFALVIAAAVVFALFRVLPPAAAPSPAIEGSSSAEQPSIAVLPFVNMSSDDEQEYFADGLSEELLYRLAQTEGLRVIARTSSFAYKGSSPDVREVGAALGVAHVLEGSVRRAGERLRVTAQLVDAEAGHHVWSESYDRSFGDVFAIQDEIAAAVTRELSVALGVREDTQNVGGTQNPDAYDLYLRALAVRNRNTPDDGRRAAELLREALAEDPEYARAWAELAWALELSGIGAPDHQALIAEARVAVDRAVALAPTMWQAHRERAVLHLIDREWEAAVQAVADARALAPPSESPCLEMLLAPLLAGHPDIALACARHLRKADPLSTEASLALIVGLYEAGREAEAYAEYERSRDLVVGNRNFIELFGLQVAWRSGDPDLAETHFERLGDLFDPTPEHLARLIAVHADEEAAREAIRTAMVDPQMQRPWLQATHALWLAHYGDDAGAAEALRLGMLLEDAPATDALWVMWMSDLAGVRRRPEFKQIVRELGFVEYWRESGTWSSKCRPLGPDDFECF